MAKEQDIANPSKPDEGPGEAPEAGAGPATEGVEEVPASAESLQQDLATARAMAEQYWDDLLHARAELENLRKRAERDVQNAHKYGLEKFLGELLPIKDSLELGLSAVQSAQDVESVVEGMQLTLKMLGDVLEKYGISEVNPDGDKFNPDLHQAVSMVEANDSEPGTVTTVIQKGYTLNERLVRPAMVAVAKKTTDAPEA